MRKDKYSQIEPVFVYLLLGAASASLTYLALNFSVERLKSPEKPTFCAPTYRMAKDIAWKTLKSLVPKMWVKSKNESDLKIELVNGSMIELKAPKTPWRSEAEASRAS